MKVLAAQFTARGFISGKPRFPCSIKISLKESLEDVRRDEIHAPGNELGGLLGVVHRPAVHDDAALVQDPHTLFGELICKLVAEGKLDLLNSITIQ